MYKSLIPNMLTSSNLVFGMCSIIATFRGDLFWASVFILIALVADGLDGRSARFFGVSSEMGKELDSLCDLVSFGAAPGMLAYSLCLHHFNMFGGFVAVFFALCGAWRLARFNVNVSVVHGYFMGLAIPAGGCLVATSTLVFLTLGFDPVSLGWIYPIVMLIVGYLMVSKVHYPDFKGKGETMYLIAKLIALVIFAGIIFWGYNGTVGSLICAVLFAVFATYAVFGIVNYSLALMSGKD